MVPTGSLGPRSRRDRGDLGDPIVAKAAVGDYQAPSRIVGFVFALFVFSVPFEAIDVLLTAYGLSLSRLIGLAMICVALTQVRTCFARPPAAFWAFAVYLLIAALASVTVSSAYSSMATEKLATRIQLLVLFWIAGNLFRYPRVAMSAIWSLAVATLIIGMLAAVGFGMTVNPDTGRLSMFAEDPNSLAGMLSLGILAWIGLGRELGHQTSVLSRYWVVPCLIIGAAVIRTGSRGGVVALLCGVLALLVAKREGRKRRPNGWIVIAMVLMVGVGLITSATNAARWRATFVEGKYSDRDQILVMAWGMFLEQPVFGWGPARNMGELGERKGQIWGIDELGGRKGWSMLDTHNGLLMVLTELGLAGSIPFVLALWLCVRDAWRGRAGAYGVTPFTLLICALVVNMSVTWNQRKPFWLVLSLAVASARVVRRSRRNQTVADEALLGFPKAALRAG